MTGYVLENEGDVRNVRSGIRELNNCLVNCKSEIYLPEHMLSFLEDLLNASPDGIEIKLHESLLYLLEFVTPVKKMIEIKADISFLEDILKDYMSRKKKIRENKKAIIDQGRAEKKAREKAEIERRRLAAIASEHRIQNAKDEKQDFRERGKNRFAGLEF
tara:strand:- start:120 stop:599 length:480 start_codon:yes stop_codon:yes gene_type:complete